ncbi:neugrin-related protein [Rhodotorula toruloides]|uniref:Required for respiratory growth protein 9, mitochondrial n=1 Tax=Rhodotorula toruloides TaxID=5286 RepID=A0A511KA87_RHOTO|nr:neugrin-related protein [Rhodotorula toruloides]
MAVRRTLALAARPLALSSSSSPSPSVAPPPPVRERAISTTRTTRFQRGWDTFDDESAFAPATTLPSLPVDPSASPFVRNHLERRPFTPTKRVPTPASREFMQRNADRFLDEEPALPAQGTGSTWRDLHPQHLHDLRLQLLRRGGRTPTDADFDQAYEGWLKRAYRDREGGILAEIKEIQREDKRREQLDLAWEWERQVAVKAGIPRTREEEIRDKVVLERLEARREESVRAQDEMRQEEERRLAAGEPPLFPLDEPEPNEPEWKKRVRANKAKFQQGWAPPKRISREAMDLVRVLHKSDPETYSTPNLASKFRISPEAIRRILKSKFELPAEERERREFKRQEAKRAETARRHLEDREGGGHELQAIRDVTAADEYYDSNGQPWARRDPKTASRDRPSRFGGGDSRSSYAPRTDYRSSYPSRDSRPSYPSDRPSYSRNSRPAYSSSERGDSRPSYAPRKFAPRGHSSEER